jgi:hypothetical protein
MPLGRSLAQVHLRAAAARNRQIRHGKPFHATAEERLPRRAVTVRNRRAQPPRSPPAPTVGPTHSPHPLRAALGRRAGRPDRWSGPSTATRGSAAVAGRAAARARRAANAVPRTPRRRPRAARAAARLRIAAPPCLGEEPLAADGSSGSLSAARARRLLKGPRRVVGAAGGIGPCCTGSGRSRRSDRKVSRPARLRRRRRCAEPADCPVQARALPGAAHLVQARARTGAQGADATLLPGVSRRRARSVRPDCRPLTCLTHP